MNTQQLESFVQVAENLSFARAAEILNITQSAVSRQINSLEEELDTKLFHRSTRTVSLTPAGISFLNDAKEVLGKLQLASQKLKSHSTSNIQPLSIGYAYESTLPFLTPILRKCRKQMPEIHPFLRIVPSRIILTLFANGEIDLLFGFKDDLSMRDGFYYHELAQVPVSCALPAAHPFVAKDVIQKKDLLSETIVICNNFAIPAQIAEIQNSLRHQFSPESAYYCENPQTALALIKAGYGIGILPEIPFDDEQMVYVPLEGNDTLLSYGVFYKDTAKNPIAKKFLSLVGIR